MFPRILEEAKKGNPRCLEHLFYLKFNALVEPDCYKRFWEIVKSDKDLLDSILKYRLSTLEAKNIKASAEYLGFKF